jgi:hypothetical protein
VGQFEVWRTATVASWIRKNEQVNYPLPTITSWYDPLCFEIATSQDAQAADLMPQGSFASPKEAYDNAFQAALADPSIANDPILSRLAKYGLPRGVSQWDLPMLPNTWGNTANPPGTPLPTPTGTPTPWIATVYGYGDFFENFAAGEGLNTGDALQVLGAMRCGNEESYATCINWLLATTIAENMMKQVLLTKKGITVFQVTQLTSMSKDRLLLAKAITKSDGNDNREQAGFLLANPEPHGIESTAHEIGHCLGLGHAPQDDKGNTTDDKGNPTMIGAQPDRHDGADANCLMSYHSPRPAYCGLCALRLCGYNGDRFNAQGILPNGQTQTPPPPSTPQLS